MEDSGARKQVVASKCGCSLAECFGVGSFCSERTHSHKLGLPMTNVRYTVFNTYKIQGHFALVPIANSFNWRYRPGWRPCKKMRATVGPKLMMTFYHRSEALRLG